jgi:HAD superfamily hydrolase (TIGR01484 family)
MPDPASPPASAPLALPGARPLRDLAEALQAGRPLVGLFTDVDDTLTDGGVLMEEARAGLQSLADDGLPVVAITGRPVGWSERFLAGPGRAPLTALVAENGAVALLPDAAEPAGWRKLYQQDAATRARHQVRLQAVLAEIEATVPGARRSADSAGRETDIAIDHAEAARLDAASVARVVGLMRERGLTATVSSIHVNGWIGAHHKAQGARWIVDLLWGRDLLAERDLWVVVGDSTNDEGLFELLPHSVGVANIARFWPQLRHRPRFVTAAARGSGVAELVPVLRAARLR